MLLAVVKGAEISRQKGELIPQDKVYSLLANETYQIGNYAKCSINHTIFNAYPVRYCKSAFNWGCALNRVLTTIDYLLEFL